MSFYMTASVAMGIWVTTLSALALLVWLVTDEDAKL